MPVSAAKDSQALKKLFFYAKPQARWIILSAICSVVIAACELSTVSLVRTLIEGALISNRVVIIQTIFMALAILVVGIIAKYYEPYGSGRLGASTIKDLRGALALHITKLQLSAKESMHSGDTLSRMNHDMTAVEEFLGKCTSYIYRPLIIIAISVYLMTIHWGLLLVSVIPVPIAIFLANRAGKPMGQINHNYQRKLGESNRIFHDLLSGIEIVKSFNLGEGFLNRYKQHQAEALAIYGRKNIRDMLMMPLMFMMYELPYVICMIYGGYLAADKQVGAGQLVVFILLLPGLVGPITQLPNMILDLKGISGVIRRVFDLLELPLERTDGEDFEMKGSNCVIEFKQVDFSYGDHEKVLSNISFQVKRGETLAIVGVSGCGKSTMMKLICGYYEADRGSIQLFGQPLEAWNLTALRRNLAMVPQEVYLFPDTIENNIRFGKLDSPHEAIVEAAKTANAHDFITGLPQGYLSQAGERGDSLSGGQKQRISIARALLKDSRVLLLDEPTSALDAQSELLLEQSLEHVLKQHTVVVIAHRLSTIKQADQIIVMDKGTIIERGTHEELLSNGGHYEQLYRKQLLPQEKRRLQRHGLEDEYA